MFKISEIKELIKLLDQTSVHELEVENEGFRLSIRKPGKAEVVQVHAPQAAPVYSVPQAVPAVQTSSVQAPAEAASAPAPAKEESDAGLHKIVSPMVGTFYSAPSPDSPVYVQVGDKINEKSIVCILEAMKLMNELEAEVKGEVVKVLVENGQLVEYGQPLFLVKPE